MNAARAQGAKPASAPQFADRLLFLLLVALLVVRPLIGELFTPVELSLVAQFEDAGGTTPVATVVLDLLLMLLSTVALIRHPRWRSSRCAALLVLAAGVGLAATHAGDRHVAWLAGLDLVALIGGGLALATVLQTRTQRNLLLAALLATGTVTTWKCLQQVWYEFPATMQQWEAEIRPDLIRKGYDPQDPLFVNFERRAASQEAYGFQSHPNVTGSMLMMWTLIAAGLTLGGIGALRRADRDLPPRWQRALVPLVFAGLGGACVAALHYTGSLGAEVALLGGAAVVLLLGWQAARAAGHSTATTAVFATLYVLLIAGGAAYGLRHGTLPNASLAFRWQYWTAGLQAWLTHPWTGIGRENFATAYMQFKSAASTEEVRNAHNIWLQLLIEMGPLGLLAGAFFAITAVRRGITQLVTRWPAAPAPRFGGTAAVLAVIVLGLHILFSGTPFAKQGIAVVWAIDVAFVWLVAFGGVLWLLETVFAPANERWLAAALVAALAGVLLHGLLSFAPLTPAGLAMCVSVAVLAAGPATPRAFAASKRTRALLGALGLALCGVYAFTIVRPTVVATHTRVEIEAAIRTALRIGQPARVEPTVAAILNRTAADPYPPREIARMLLQVSRAPEVRSTTKRAYLQLAMHAVDVAIARNPLNMNHYATRARIWQELAREERRDASRTAELHALRQAAADWDRAVARYPTDPRAQLSAAHAWFSVWEATQDSAAAERVRGHLDAALAIDAQRAPGEVVRLRAAELAEIDQLRAALPH